MKKVGFLVYVLVATVILLEICLRLFFPQPLTKDAPELYIPDETIGWRRRPNAHGTAQWQGPVVEVCTDSKADRVSCLAKPASTCVARILAIGDSFVESLSVQYEQTVWFRIEQDTGACVDVAGVGGYGPSQYLQSARERLRGRVPYQVVIVNIYVGNDFKADASRIPPSREVQRFRVHALPKGLTRVDFRNWLYPVNQGLESRSHAFVAFRNVFRRKHWAEHTELALRPSQLTEEVIDESLRPIRDLAREAAGAGAAVIIVLIPSYRQVLDPTGESLVRAVPLLEGDLDMDLPAKRIGPRLQGLSGAQFVDLLPGLRTRATAKHWGELDPHFSPEGHALWFELVQDEVRKALGSSAIPNQLLWGGHPGIG